MLIALVLLGIVSAGGVGAVGLAVSRHYRKSTQVVPGVQSPAPANWQGSHDPEARLHRRLQDAIASLRVISDVAGTHGQMVGTVERKAIEIDRQLVATSLLNPRHRAISVVDLEAAVQRIERISADMVSHRTATTDKAIVDQLDRLEVRLRSMDSARAEVEEEDRRGRRQTS